MLARIGSVRLKLVIMKRGGEPGEVAINPDLVTHVRATSGAFTDIHFGEYRIAVEGTLHQVIARLASSAEQPSSAPAPAPKTWLR